MEVRSRSKADGVAPSGADGRVVRERNWFPTVLVRGAIAVVWDLLCVLFA